MKYTSLFFLLVLALSCFSFESDNPAYNLFDGAGKQVSYKNMVEQATKADVVFFGENHDNPICHWLELELTKDLYDAKKDNLILGAEMFEADVQVTMNEYLNGYIKESAFKENSRPWPNYETDYKPLINFAKEHKIPFIATNIPRRYASIVAAKGLEHLDSILSKEARQWMASLPIVFDSSLKCYKDMLGMKDPSHSGINVAKAQALKDATMAYFILQNLGKGKTFLHYNGAYHSNNKEGICWYLKQARPKLKIMTISSTEQENIHVLDKESLNLADYIICTPEDMYKTR